MPRPGTFLFLLLDYSVFFFSFFDIRFEAVVSGFVLVDPDRDVDPVRVEITAAPEHYITLNESVIGVYVWLYCLMCSVHHVMVTCGASLRSDGLYQPAVLYWRSVDGER